MTERDMQQYLAADDLDLVPNWRELKQILLALAGQDPEQMEAEPQDLTTLYQKRKAAHGR